MNATSAKDILLHPQSSDSSDIKEAVEYAVKAIDKQIARKPIARDLWELGTATGHSCPNCGYAIPYTKQPKHCEVCGQALDWSDTENDR